MELARTKVPKLQMIQTSKTIYGSKGNPLNHLKSGRRILNFLDQRKIKMHPVDIASINLINIGPE